jgi:hypothetical protein
VIWGLVWAFWLGRFGLVISILTPVDFVGRTFDLRWVGIFGMGALGGSGGTGYGSLVASTKSIRKSLILRPWW